MSKSEPKISVVIPLYNKAAHIIETLNSVRQQRYAAAEIIVIDDGSSDGSADLVEQLNWPELVLIKQENAGVSTARNRGIEVARSEYVALLDADDHWTPLFLEEMANAIQALPGAGLYASAYQYRDSEDVYTDAKIHAHVEGVQAHIMDDYFAIASRGDLPFITSSVVLDRSIFLDRFAFPVGEGMGEDQDVWSQIALYSAIVYCPRILVIYNREADNRACIQNIPKQECPFSARLSEVAEAERTSPRLRSDILRYSAAHILALAKLNIEAGHLGTARAMLNDQRCWRKPLHKLRCEVMHWGSSLGQLGRSRI